MFSIRYKDSPTGGYTTLELRPVPTTVDYPEARLFETQESQDKGVIIQRPMRDPRPRRWIWEGYTSAIPLYESQWQQLVQLEYHTRVEQSKYPLVEIYENVSGIGGFDRKDSAGSPIYTQVKIIQVDRELASGGGRPVYEESYITFVIADDTYTYF